VDFFADANMPYNLRDLLIEAMVAACILGVILYGLHERNKSSRFPLSPDRERRGLQEFIEQHALKNPEASLANLQVYLERAQKRNTRLSFVAHESHIAALLLNQKPVEVTIEGDLYRAQFGIVGQPEAEFYASPLALVWHICHWNLTYEDEKRFYRKVKKARLYEVRNNLVYFHISVKDYSSFKKIGGVWHHEPHTVAQLTPQGASHTA
jgi:hypothetical protein